MSDVMLSQNVEVIGLQEFIDDVERAGGDVQPLITAALANATQHSAEEIRSGAPHATGALQRSTLAEVDYPTGFVRVNEDYGSDVEYGTSPHMPNVSAIEQWVKKKGLPSDALWPIVQTIKKRGTRAQPFFAPGVSRSEPYVLSQFAIVADRLMDILTGKGRS